MIFTLFCSVILYAYGPNGRLYQCFLITIRLRNLDILKYINIDIWFVLPKILYYGSEF